MGNQVAQRKSLLASTSITLLVVTMLIISGPAQAVSVIISGLSPSYPEGSSFVNFTVSIDINDPDKFVPLTNLTINVTGPTNLERTFALDGAPISGDPLIRITAVSTPRSNQFGYGYGYGIDGGAGYNFGYGYGYGYGYGAGGGAVTYRYDVSIISSSLPAGSYTAAAKLNTGKSAKQSFDSSPAVFEITALPPPAITSWGNNKTNNASLIFAINQSETVRLNATANQTISLWRWYVDGVNQSNNNDFLDYSSNIIGIHSVKVNATNDNGTSNIVEWIIDVKPAPVPVIRVNISIENKKLNPNSNEAIWVDILSNATFNATIVVNPDSVRFGPLQATIEPPGEKDKDINKDGFLDLRLKFKMGDTGIKCGDTQATLIGKTFTGLNIIGTDTFETIGCGGGGGPGGGSSGGNGGGGGGVVSGEPRDNVRDSDRHEKDLLADKPVEFPLKKGMVKGIILTGKENEADVTMSVEYLKALSKNVKDVPPGEVYYYLNILSSSKRIKEAVVKFQVDASWLASNNIAEGDVRLLRYDGTAWKELETRMTGKDNGFVNFESILSGFSYFAVSAIKSAAPVVAEAARETPVSAVTPEATKPALPTKPPSRLNVILYVTAAIMIGIVIYLLVMKKGSK